MRKFLLRATYIFLKRLVKLMFSVYYPNTQTDNLAYLNTKGPVILLSNHPNGMIDPLDTALRSKRMVHFLAKAELFNNPLLHWFFNTFYCIPIERPDFSNGQVVDNTENFNRCNEFLQQGGALYIAPEGTSELVRRLLDLKTGAARIALQAEASMDFKMGIKIIPAGITYVNQGEFRSAQYICSSEPITISDFKDIYSKEPRKAVLDLTNIMKSKLKELIIILDNDNDIPLFESLMLIFYKDIQLNPKEFYIKGKLLAQKLNDLNQKEPDKISLLKNAVKEIEQLAISKSIQKEDIEAIISSWSLIRWILNLLVCLIGLPVYLFGLVNHLIPNLIPWLIERQAKFHIIYRSTMKMLIGLVSYLVIYSIQIIIIWMISDHLYTLVIYVISLVISGLWFYSYLNWVKRLICHCKALFIPLSEKNALKNKILTLKYLINN